MQIKIQDEYFQLTTEEFYVYCWLRSNMNYHCSEYLTTIGLVVDCVQILKKKQNNKQKIIEVLDSLKQKHIINIEDDIQTVSQHKPIRIKFACRGDIKSKYTTIDSDMLEVNDHRYFFVLATLLKWQNVQDKQFSLIEWANILHVSVKTAQKILNDMEQIGLIAIQRGQYYEVDNGLRQEMNRYSICGRFANSTNDNGIVVKNNDNTEVVDEYIGETDRIIDKPSKPITNNIITDSRVLERDNLINDDKRMNEDDFWIYVTTEDPVVKRLADERFARISKNPNGKKFVDNMLRKAKIELQQKQKRDQEMEQLMHRSEPPAYLEMDIYASYQKAKHAREREAGTGKLD